MVQTKLITQLKKFKIELSTEIPIAQMILFGSQAYGKPHPDSDIDLIIVSSKFKKKKSYERALGFRKYWHLNYPVDFLCYTPQEFKKLSKEITLVKIAREKGIEI